MTKSLSSAVVIVAAVLFLGNLGEFLASREAWADVFTPEGVSHIVLALSSAAGIAFGVKGYQDAKAKGDPE